MGHATHASGRRSTVSGQFFQHQEPVLYVKVALIIFHYYTLQATIMTIEINYLLTKETIKLVKDAIRPF